MKNTALAALPQSVLTSEVFTTRVSTMELRARIDTPLKRALVEDGRRQDWLASRIGANADQVSKWVNGVHVPVEATREAIARELGRNVDDLFPPQALGLAA